MSNRTKPSRGTIKMETNQQPSKAEDTSAQGDFYVNETIQMV